MSSNNQPQKSLLERIEVPAGIPQDAAKKIARIEEEFTRAEVETCMHSLFH